MVGHTCFGIAQINYPRNYNNYCKSNCKIICNPFVSDTILRASRNGSSRGNCFTGRPCSTIWAKEHRTLNLIMSLATGNPVWALRHLAACKVAKVWMSWMQVLASWRSEAGKFATPLQFCASG